MLHKTKLYSPRFQILAGSVDPFTSPLGLVSMEGAGGGQGATTPVLARQFSHPNHYDFCALPSRPVCGLQRAAYLQFPAVKSEGRGQLQTT